jgi:hypothetical protein
MRIKSTGGLSIPIGFIAAQAAIFLSINLGSREQDDAFQVGILAFPFSWSVHSIEWLCVLMAVAG